MAPTPSISASPTSTPATAPRTSRANPSPPPSNISPAHNVRGYVAFNTLIFSDELSQAIVSISEIASAGADAVIVQDLGLLHLIGLMAPSLERHGSTQNDPHRRPRHRCRHRHGHRPRHPRPRTLRRRYHPHHPGNPHPRRGLLPRRPVRRLQRPMPDQRIDRRAAPPTAASAPRACRLPYEIIVDGQEIDQAGRQFLLSPQDLAAYDRGQRSRPGRRRQSQDRRPP